MELGEQIDELERRVAALREAVEADASVEALHARASELAAWTHVVEMRLREQVVAREVVETVRSLGLLLG